MSCPCPPSSSCLDLLDGIALFIDDQIEDKNSSAYKLKKQVEDENIPVVSKKEIPDEIDSFVKNLLGISFVILDWKFSPNPDLQIPPRVRIPENVEISATIDFLKSLLAATYCPVFIISQENVEEIQRHLDNEKITINGFHPRVFVSGKDDLLNGKLFASLNDWIKKRPITYTLKTWEMAANDAKMEMFSLLEKKHTSWPYVLWKTFGDDHTNQSNALSESLCNIFSNNLIANTCFEEERIKSEDKVCPQDIRAVLEAERFMPVSEVIPPAPGDLFKTDNEGYYLLNIRAQCNLLHIEDPDLYCIRGIVLKESKILTATQKDIEDNDNVLFFKGQLHGHDDIVYIPFVLEGKF